MTPPFHFDLFFSPSCFTKTNIRNFVSVFDQRCFTHTKPQTSNEGWKKNRRIFVVSRAAFEVWFFVWAIECILRRVRAKKRRGSEPPEIFQELVLKGPSAVVYAEAPPVIG